MYRWVARIKKTGGVISRLSNKSYTTAVEAIKDYEDNARGKFIAEGWAILSVEVKELP